MRTLLQHLQFLIGRDDKPREACHYAALDNGNGMRVFVKTYPAHVKEEFRRSQDIYETSIAGSAFRAPRVIAIVESHNVNIWKCLDNLMPIREFLVQCLSHKPDGLTLSARVMHDCGSLLGLTHRRWAPTGNADYSRFLPEIHSPSTSLNRHVQSTLQESCCQWVHGDFGCANIFMQSVPGTPSAITVVDASMNRFVFDSDHPDIVAPGYVDVSHFISSLYHRRHFFYSRVRKRVPLWIEEFLVGYEETSGQRVDHATVFACAAKTMNLYEKYLDRQSERPTLEGWRDRRFRRQCSKQLFDAAVQHLPVVLPD